MGRETFTSLKATRYAHRIASEILHADPLDATIECPECKMALDMYLLEGEEYRCTRCGARVSPPARVVNALRNPKAELAEAQRRAKTPTEKEKTERSVALVLTFVIGFWMLVFALIAIVPHW